MSMKNNNNAQTNKKEKKQRKGINIKLQILFLRDL